MDLTLTPRLLPPTPSALRRSRTVVRATAEPLTDISGPEYLISDLPPPVRRLSSLAIAAGSLAAGYNLGLRVLQTRGGAIGGAAVIGAAGGAVVYNLGKGVRKVAAARIRSLVLEDPAVLKKRDVEDVLWRYGVSKNEDVIRDEFYDLYSRFISSIIPLRGEEISGNEVEKIIKFKEALGIDDTDAASAHMEIGRRIFRERLETGDRETNAEQHRVFQRLIYVSTLVFGDASKFLLPWKRVFKVTDAQVDIAVRDNAQRLYALKLKSVSRDIEDRHLIDLRECQISYGLSDEVAADMFREHTRNLIEENISAALEILKSVTKSTGTTPVVEELEKVLAFNNLFTKLTKHPESGRFALGFGPISLIGGKYDSHRKLDDLKLLYRAYVAESFPNGRFEEKNLVPLNHLKELFGLTKHEAEDIILDIKSKIYRKRLSQIFANGDLVEAASRAAFLHDLCDEIYFDADKASEVHEEIYRKKLQQCLADGELDGVDVAALQRLRVLLCIPQETVDEAHADICGRVFEKVVKDAIASGIEGYDDDARTSVQKASQGLQLPEDAAMAIASKAARKVFMNYIRRSRSSDDHTEAAKELKKMIDFNNLVVSELIYDIKGDLVTESVIEQSEQTEEDELESLQTLRKTKLNSEILAKSGQAEINLRDDLPQKDRADLYRTYLKFCQVPLGAEITNKKTDAELHQLGQILGLTSSKIVEIHRNLAEQAFMKKAEVILADGQLTQERIEQLNEAQNQVGLPEEYAQKIIKKITIAKMSAAVEMAVNQGRFGIKQARELKESGINLDAMISESLRENLFKKSVEEIFSSGIGSFDEEEVYVRIPDDLSIDAENAKRVAREIAKLSLSSSLVQAVALLRQRNREGAVSSLNDILACDMAVPTEQPLSWSSQDELAHLYCIYSKGVASPDRISRLQHLFGISDSTAVMLQDRIEEVLLLPNEEETYVY